MYLSSKADCHAGQSRMIISKEFQVLIQCKIHRTLRYCLDYLVDLKSLAQLRYLNQISELRFFAGILDSEVTSVHSRVKVLP